MYQTQLSSYCYLKARINQGKFYSKDIISSNLALKQNQIFPRKSIIENAYYYLYNKLTVVQQEVGENNNLG